MNKNILSANGKQYAIETYGMSIPETQNNLGKVTPYKGKRQKWGKNGKQGKKRKVNKNILSVNGKDYTIQTEGVNIPEIQNNLEKVTPYKGKQGKMRKNRKKGKMNKNILSANGKQYTIETDGMSIPETQNNLEKLAPYRGKKQKWEKNGKQRKNRKMNENILSVNGKQYTIESEKKSIPETQNNLDKRLLGVCVTDKVDLEELERLLEAGADINYSSGGRTCLMYTSHKGSYEATQMLLEFKAKVNMKDDYGKTALHFASEHDHIDVVRLLLQHGADPYIKGNDGDGDSPVFFDFSTMI